MTATPIFRQLFEPVSSTFTYLLGCAETGQALLIDPVMPTWQRDLDVINSLGLRLAMTVDTHIHADHITSAAVLRRESGSRIAMPAAEHLECADIGIEHDVPLTMGGLALAPLHTPGHTETHFSLHTGDRVFTGDALLIDGCGRTDFQGGDAGTLYHSVRDILFALPNDTIVYPGHDYTGRHVSSIAQERTRNPRLGGDRSLEAFVEIMANLNLPYPKFIDHAVPGNRACGLCPDNLPEHLSAYCPAVGESRQG